MKETGVARGRSFMSMCTPESVRFDREWRHFLDSLSTPPWIVYRSEAQLRDWLPQHYKENT